MPFKKAKNGQLRWKDSEETGFTNRVRKPNILVRPNARGLQVLEKEEVDRLAQVRFSYDGRTAAIALA